MVGTALLLGGALGVRHAVEADHLAAVATLVPGEDRPLSTGAAWGVGHSLPILVLGAAFLSLGLRIPPGIGAAVEGVVGVLLIGLGLRVLAGRRAIGTAILRHVHGRDGRSGGGHLHVSIAGRKIGLVHSHADEESFAIGVVHGLAGSGIVVVALAAAAPTPHGGAAFLAGFSLATIVTMGVVAAVGGRAIRRIAVLRVIAGLATVAVGGILLVDVIGATPPI